MTYERYKDWLFIQRDGTPYTMPEDKIPRRTYARNTLGEWYWFRNTGQDLWFRKESQVPRHIRMAAMLLE